MANQPQPAVRVWIALGSNLGSNVGSTTTSASGDTHAPVADLHQQLDAAEAALAALAQPSDSMRVSPRYVSEAMPVPERPHERQPDYLNAVVSLCTELAPLELLDALQVIEAAAGRVRIPERRWAARPLDLDLLLYADRCIDSERLQVPHPGIADRAFVVRPLVDLDPDLDIPGLGGVQQLLERVPMRDALVQVCA